MVVDIVSPRAMPASKASAAVHTDLFDELVVALKDALGPSLGLTSDDVDVNFLTRLMEDYDCGDGAWSRYAFGDASRGYTRNLVDDGNGKSNLVRLDSVHPTWPVR